MTRIIGGHISYVGILCLHSPMYQVVIQLTAQAPQLCYVICLERISLALFLNHLFQGEMLEMQFSKIYLIVYTFCPKLTISMLCFIHNVLLADLIKRTGSMETQKMATKMLP